MKKDFLTKFKIIFNKLPFEISILALGLSGLASGLNIILKNNTISPYIFIPRLILMFIVLIMFIIVLILCILNKKRLLFELKKPNFLPIVPTFFMTLSNLGNFIGTFGLTINHLNNKVDQNLENIFYLIGTILLYVALIIHLFWWGFIIYTFFIHHKLSLLKDSLGSWGVPFVGMAIYCANTNGMLNNFKYISFEFNQVIWWFSFINFVILFPCLVIRHIKFKLNNDQLNSAAVFAAPSCLLLAGFINTFCQEITIKITINIYGHTFIDGFIITFLIFSFCLIIFLLVWLFVAKNNKHYSIAAFTFPFAINTIAIANVATLSKNHFDMIIFNEQTFNAFNIISMIWFLIMFFVYLYVFYRFINFFIIEIKLINNSILI